MLLPPAEPKQPEVPTQTRDVKVPDQEIEKSKTTEDSKMDKVMEMFLQISKQMEENSKKMREDNKLMSKKMDDKNQSTKEEFNEIYQNIESTKEGLRKDIEENSKKVEEKIEETSKKMEDDNQQLREELRENRCV